MTETVGYARICVALDRDSAAANIALVEELSGAAQWFKVGLRQFYSPGAPEVIAAVRASGAKLFLDLKLHDIPKTVGDATAALAEIAPELLTVHAGGGAAMIAAAAEALPSGCGVLAVTVLTSLDRADLGAMWGGAVDGSLEDVAGRLASTAVDAGAVGVVCSAHEAASLRLRLGSGPQLVTPGIRPAGAARGDQKRVMTPSEAVSAGSSLLVVGRPIHGAQSPRAALDAIATELVT